MKVQVTQDEKNLKYYKYYSREMAPVSKEKMDILAGEPLKPEQCLPVEMRVDYIKGEDTAYPQIGFGVAENGTGFVANSIFMPYAEPKMMDWFLTWHAVGPDLRYKLWNPEEHYFAKADNPNRLLDDTIPDSQKNWGVTHYILEDIGMGPDFVKLHMLCPADIGIDLSLIGTPKCAGIGCGMGEGNVPALTIHKWYPCEGGMMFESRFWIGYGFDDKGEVVKLIPDGIAVPPIAPKCLYHHNIKEYTNLGSFLAELYEAEH